MKTPQPGKTTCRASEQGQPEANIDEQRKPKMKQVEHKCLNELQERKKKCWTSRSQSEVAIDEQRKSDENQINHGMTKPALEGIKKIT